MLNLAIFKASLLLETPLSGVLPKFEIEPTSNRVIFTYNPSTFITKTKCQIAFNGPLHSMLNGFNCSKINIFTTEVYFDRTSIQLSPQYANYFFSNVVHSKKLFFIEAAPPGINTGQGTSEGSFFKTFLLVNQNAGTIESSVSSPYNNSSVSSHIVGILDNQLHSLYYNSVIYDTTEEYGVPQQNIFDNTRFIGTSSNHLPKTFDNSQPFTPLNTNNDVAGFPNIIFYRSMVIPFQANFTRMGDSTVITCVAGDYACGFATTLNLGDYPVYWKLKNNPQLDGSRYFRLAEKLYTEAEFITYQYRGRVFGSSVALDGGQWFLGYNIHINNEPRKGVLWKYDNITQQTTKTTTIKAGTKIQFFAISQDEKFILGASVTFISPIQNGLPIIYNRETNTEVAIMAPNNDLSIYLTTIEMQRDYKKPVNAQFINNLLYITSNITFKTDIYSYNSVSMMFEIADHIISSIMSFSLKDFDIDDNIVNLYGVENKAKTPLNTLSIANPLVIYSDKRSLRPLIASNIYPIVSAFPVPIGETKIIQFNTSLQIGNNIHTINFSSNLLPISKSSIANPVIFNDQVPGHPFEEEVPLNSSNNSISNIVTDFTQYLGTGTEDRNMLLYNPSGEYRLVNLINNQPVRDIDLTVTYTDNFGASFPLLLRPQCSATIKLLFRKKDFYNRN